MWISLILIQLKFHRYQCDSPTISVDKIDYQKLNHILRFIASAARLDAFSLSTDNSELVSMVMVIRMLSSALKKN